MTEAEKRRAIDLALVAMDKQFGKGAVLRLGADNALQKAKQNKTARPAVFPDASPEA